LRSSGGVSMKNTVMDPSVRKGHLRTWLEATKGQRCTIDAHVFQMGAQGFVNKGGGADHFMDRLEEWLRANKVLASK
jgi:hypothetical protein